MSSLLSTNQRLKNEDWKRYVAKRSCPYRAKLFKQTYHVQFDKEKFRVTDYYWFYVSRERWPSKRRRAAYPSDIAPFLSGEYALPDKVTKEMSTYVKEKNDENRQSSYRVIGDNPRIPKSHSLQFPLMYIVYRRKFYHLEEHDHDDERRVHYLIAKHIDTEKEIQLALLDEDYAECFRFEALLLIPSYLQEESCELTDEDSSDDSSTCEVDEDYSLNGA
jgi:hypothetical protein